MGGLPVANDNSTPVVHGSISFIKCSTSNKYRNMSSPFCSLKHSNNMDTGFLISVMLWYSYIINRYTSIYIYMYYIYIIWNGDFLSHWGYPQIIQATHLDVWLLEHGEHSWKPAGPQPQKDRENMGKQKSNPTELLKSW